MSDPQVDEFGRPEPPRAAPPERMTEAFLDFLRATLLWKMGGLSEEELRRPMVPSGTSLLAILKHSAYVERSWFQHVFAGEDVAFPWTKEDPDADWRIEPGETFASIRAFYEGETARSREIVATASWHDPATTTRSGQEPHTLGWILCHMVEEVARHCGHADILREQIDGMTGE